MKKTNSTHLHLLRRIILLSSVSVLLLLSPLSASASTGITEDRPMQTITMSIEQFNKWKNLTETQEMTLNLLEQKLDLLEGNSTTQQKQSMELLNQLTECRTQLQICKEQLQTTNNKLEKAEISLNEAEEQLQKNDNLLKKLNEQINGLKHHYRVKMFQNILKSLGAGIVIGYVIHN